MTFSLTILGVNGATPAHGRFPTSQYLQVHNDHFLIDCGEGAQMRMSDFGVPRQKINRIFISHLHGDHIFGLPGLLFSFALNNRTSPIHIHSPEGLKELLLAQLLPGGGLPFPLHFHLLDTENEQMIHEGACLTVHSFPLKHRIPTCGFRFEEKEAERNIRSEKISELNLSIDEIRGIKLGGDLVREGKRVYVNEELTLPKWKTRSFAYASDTLFDSSIIPFLKEVDLLYHETTFCEDFAENAKRTMHSTAKQAALMAKKANAKRLITGHYSSRYKDLKLFFDEASGVFKNTTLGIEGGVYEIQREREGQKNPA